jgi:hypothetical protein
MKKFKELRESYLEEKLKASDPAGTYIHDFVHSDNPKFAGKSKAKRIQMALAASYGAKGKSRNEEVEELDEISQKLATKAYAKRDSEAFDRHDLATNADDSKDADKASAKAKKTYDRIGKRFGVDAQKKADKAAHKEIFGEEVDEGIVDTVKSVAKKVGKALTGGSDQDQLKNLQKKMGVPQTGKKPTSK